MECPNCAGNMEEKDIGEYLAYTCRRCNLTIYKVKTYIPWRWPKFTGCQYGTEEPSVFSGKVSK